MGQYFLTSRKKKKGQVWGLDLVVASIIFLVGIIILYFYIINYSSQSRSLIEELSYDGNLGSDLILSEEDYGIVSEGKIDQTKLDEFYNIDYSLKKGELGLTNDFYFTLNSLEIEGSPVSYVGKMNETDIGSLIKITRVTVYKDKLTKFEIFVYK